jgi:hypothetical protein
MQSPLVLLHRAPLPQLAQAVPSSYTTWFRIFPLKMQKFECDWRYAQKILRGTVIANDVGFPGGIRTVGHRAANLRRICPSHLRPMADALVEFVAAHHQTLLDAILLQL